MKNQNFSKKKRFEEIHEICEKTVKITKFVNILLVCLPLIYFKG